MPKTKASPTDGIIDPIERLTRDVRQAASMSDAEGRYLVDLYYQIQEFRKATGNQIRTMEKEPIAVLAWSHGTMEIIEKEIRYWLDKFTDRHHMGRWAKGIVGIGPVISAGLLANIDMEPWKCIHTEGKKCRESDPHPHCGRQRINTVGHIWSFAGLDPRQKWERGQKRPWNATLRTLCWKIGESFVKVSGHDDDFYGKLYVARKQRETLKNENGDYADQAREKLETTRISKSTDAYVWYAGCLTKDAAVQIREADPAKRQPLMRKLMGKPGSGVPMLPPARIHLRAKRYAVKIFLSHWHGEAYQDRFGEPAPMPYPIAHLGHTDMIHPPKVVDSPPPAEKVGK